MKKATGFISIIFATLLMTACDNETCNQLVGEGTCNAVLLEVFSAGSQIL